jgi:nitroreductase
MRAMDAHELLSTRASNGKLRDPAPDDATLERIVQYALRAPDHGLLRPWRIQLVRGAAREKLGTVLRGALERRSPGAAAEALEKEQRKTLRAPLIAVVSARLRQDPKVPQVEQLLATGAFAHGLLLGVHLHGFAALWRTGPAAYDDEVKRALGIAPGDAIVGFVYIGTPALPAPAIERQRARDVLEEWPPAAT